MKLEMGNLPKEKQKFVIIGVVVVIVGIVGYFGYSMFGGGGGDQTATTAATAPPAPGTPPGAPGTPPAAPGTPPATAAPGGPPAPGQPAAGAPASAGAPPAGQPGPSAGTTAPAATPAAQRGGKPVAGSSAPPAAPKSITVFGSVTVTYPAGWGIGMGASGSSAVLSDGRGRFEVRTPDLKAADAKSIAAKAVTTITGKAPGSLPQGALKVGGCDAYYYMAGDKRIVGVDAPTRIVLVEYAKGASFSAYSAVFDKMQADIKFK